VREEVTASAPPPQSRRERAARGTIVNAGFNVGLSVLALVRSFAVAIFLTVSDYGVWGILVVVLGTLQFLRQVGISDRYVQQDDPDQRLAFQKAFTAESVFSVGFAVVESNGVVGYEKLRESAAAALADAKAAGRNRCKVRTV
jgi:hypothetical protein